MVIQIIMTIPTHWYNCRDTVCVPHVCCDVTMTCSLHPDLLTFLYNLPMKIFNCIFQLLHPSVARVDRHDY